MDTPQRGSDAATAAVDLRGRDLDSISLAGNSFPRRSGRHRLVPDNQFRHL
jgi:hypothetical protein